MKGKRRGFFEIVVVNPKTETNIGTLFRSAYQLGAVGFSLVGRRYKKQASDTYNTTAHVPLREYETWEQFMEVRPKGSRLIAVEMGGAPLSSFRHPEQAIYVLGAEDNGLPKQVAGACHHLVTVEHERVPSYNLAVAGSIVMWHRFVSR